MKTKSYTSSYALFLYWISDSIYKAKCAIRLIGQGMRLVGYWVWVAWSLIRLGWYCLVFLFCWWFILVVIWDFTELLGIPIIQDFKGYLYRGYKSAVHFVVSAQCRHISQRNGFRNSFCPLCGKKLIETGQPPRRQL